MIDYTFIIPHKNNPALLRKCLDSIPHHEGVQIIVVDDNSDPTKVDFDHFPGIGEPFTEVFLTNEGHGAGYARNVGLSHASGKWIVFADADDFFLPCIKDAMGKFKKINVDVVFFKGSAIRLSDGAHSERGEYFNKCVDKALNNHDYSSALQYSAPWRKFYRRSFLEDNTITFNECRWGNDVVFSCKVAVCASTYEASAMSIYCTTESPGSLIQARSLESQIVRYGQEREGTRILRQKYPVSQISCYLFHAWHNVFRISKREGLRLLPSAITVCGFAFISEFVRFYFM